MPPFVAQPQIEEFPDDMMASHSSSEPENFSMNDEQKIGRNDPCPCGSGLKFKQCHGKLA